MIDNRARDDARGSATGRFFLWCAGADTALLARLPRSETIKQIGFGTLVLVPALLALFAMTYALSTLSGNPLIYATGGVLWAAIVFCFDRFLVSSFRKSGSVTDDVSSAVFLSRLAMAGFVGMIVAHPLVMLYFRESIDERLDLERQGRMTAIAAAYDAERQGVQEQVVAVEAEIRQRELLRDRHQLRLIDEIDGVVSGRTTGIPGRGASAEEKKLQLERAERELAAARSRGIARIEELRLQLSGLAGSRREATQSYRQSRDYLARVGALEALARESPHVDRLQWFLILFFVFVDVLPILFKGLTPAGPYDERLRFVEYKSVRSVRAKWARLERGDAAVPATASPPRLR